MKTDTPDDTEEPTDDRPLLSVPVAFALGLAFIVVTLGGSYWLVRARTQPSPDEGIPLATVWARQGTVFPTPTTVPTRVPTTAAAPTSVAAPAQPQPAALPTPVPQVTAQPIGAGAPTSAQPTPTTAAAIAIATPVLTPGPEQAAGEPPAAANATVVATPQLIEIGADCLAQSGVPQEPAKEVASAYLRYFQVSAEALFQLKPELLDEATAGEELAALQKNIEDDRARGRALRTDVQHYCVVLRVQGDNAYVGDDYRDSSIYVDAVTHSPLPGQEVPPSPDVAPEFKVVYELQRIDGVWKVVDGERVQP